MGDVVQIQITPEYMLQSAEVMLEATMKAVGAISEMEELTVHTQTYFCGKAGESFRAKMREVMEEWRLSVDVMKENVTELQEIAEEYRKAEGENKDAATRN